MSRMPTAYNPPLGTPFFWMDEESGELRRAIEAYLDNRIHGAGITAAQILLVRDYLAHYINAPCWKGPHGEPSELEHLRSTVQLLDNPAKIAAWIYEALDIGMDPL